MSRRDTKQRVYNNRTNDKACRNGTNKAYFDTKKQKYGYNAPPTKNQVNYITYLMHFCESHDIPVTGVSGNMYMRLNGEAHRVIRRLISIICEHTGAKVKYVVLCKNEKTGESKKFLSPSNRRAPKGWKLIGVIEKRIEFPNGEDLELNDEAIETIEYNIRGLLA